MNVADTIRKIIFGISIIINVAIIGYYGKAVIFGYYQTSFFSHQGPFYGVEALEHMQLEHMFFIPVFLILLLYQLIYFSKTRKKS